MRRVLLLHRNNDQLDDLVEALRRALGRQCDVERTTSPTRATELLALADAWDLMLVDLGRRDGFANLRRCAAVTNAPPLVAVADAGSVETASKAVAAGASDLLVRGERLAERVSTLQGKIEKLIELARENRGLREQNRLLGEENHRRHRIVGESKAMIALMQRAKRVAPIPRPVLIIGERGTGKELLARAIHASSPRADEPLVTVNCGALPDALLESELFGHERGAFTGADRTVAGKFEMAGNGTLFLDEIGNMSLAFQQKILRVIEYGTYRRVGGAEELRTSARILAATNANLKERMARGEFLRDLYDRLSFDVMEIPPLRERPEDIALLAQMQLEEFQREVPSLAGKRLSHGALERLRGYRFPGNVRELKNVVERAACRTAGAEITAEDIGPLEDVSLASAAGAPTFEARVAEFERGLVLQALDTAGGNQAEAARLLGVSYHQLRYLVGKHGLKG